MAHDDDPLSIIMADLQARLEGRVRAAGDVAARLRDLAARYAAAVKADAEAELARRHGRPASPPDPSPAHIAAELFDLVAAVPELQDDKPDADQPAVEPPPALPPSQQPASFHELISSAGHEQPEPVRPPRAEQPHPEVLRLLDDFRDHDLDALATPLFRALAEELAARARLLQEQGVADPDASATYVIRALTAASDKRGIRNIHGLRRKDQADWQQRIDQARRQQEKLRAAPPRPKAVPSPRRHDDEADDGAPVEPWELPRLAARTSHGAVVILGGVVKPEKLDRLREHLGFGVEWLETTTTGMGSTTALERRIREGHVVAVVVLEGLISHKHSEQVVAAARHAGVPVAYGGTAGTGKLKEAFERIETMLGRPWLA